MTREAWVIARGILIDAGIQPAWAKVKTGEQYLIRDAEVVLLRRATLEEAARAVKEAQPTVRADVMERYGLDLGWSSMQAECLRKIHDLIAALDKEASHE